MIRSMSSRLSSLATTPVADDGRDRRRAATGPRRLDLVPDELAVDLERRTASVRGHAVGLTAKEAELLAFLVGHRGRVFSKEQLLERVWGYTYGSASTVTVHIRRLRAKIEPDPGRPVHIQTVRGAGYRVR